ncbi:hypothetical protein Pint_22152 [Pistacia integerrima]|uniref:Uncharacterized protein n=1 Tax=Pistacia integerrima TaxID=434235 RepID=A0ACC0YLU7_9ROSI|nr:hypothetical protein Pint_22152 [Pistacia integerrima]
MFLVPSIVLFLLSPYSGAENNDEYCPPTRCSPDGPEVRYPFRLKTQHPFCGHEGFELSCSNNKTLLHLPSSSDYYVQGIYYSGGRITITDVQETACALQSILVPNLINSRFYVPPLDECTIFNCTERIKISSSYYSVKKFCLQIVVKYKTVKTSIDWGYGTGEALTNPGIRIRWKPHKGCDNCENSGRYCGFNKTSKSVMCCKHENPKFCSNYLRHHSPVVKILVSIAASIGGSIFLVLVILLPLQIMEI